MQNVKQEFLERYQIAIYFAAVFIAAIVAITIPGTQSLQPLINPALALMLFVTFLQVPLRDLRRPLISIRFIGALMFANFLAVPLLVAVLFPFVPDVPMVQLGVLLVLLT